MTGAPGGSRSSELGPPRVELGRWMRAHPVWGVVAILLLLAFINQVVGPPPPGNPAELAAGDCLVIHVSAPEPGQASGSPVAASTPPGPLVGDPVAVEAVLMAGGALRAGCGTAHDHEVSAVLTVGGASGAGSGPSAPGGASTPGSAAASGAEGASFPGREALVAEAGPACDAAFPGYVGAPIAGSLYVTYPAVPTAGAWAAGARTAVCLVARADGRLMDHPARGSRE
jgi:hypothetical protein